MVVVLELAYIQLDGTMAHCLHEGVPAELALDAAQHGALLPVCRMEHALYAAESQHALREQVGTHVLAVSVAHGHAEQVRDYGKRLPVGLQDFLLRAEVPHRLPAARPEHHLVQVAFDDGVHLAAVFQAKLLDAGFAQRVLLRVHQGVLGAVQQVVAQESGDIRLGNAVGRFGQVDQGIRHGFHKRGRSGVVHVVAQLHVFRGCGVRHAVEQRVGALVAQQERVALALGLDELAGGKL